MTSQKQERTDALTELADKYQMSARDRTTLFKLYIEAAQIPPDFVVVPREASEQMLGILCSDEARRTSHSYWRMAKDFMAERWRKALSVAPKPEPARTDKPVTKDDKWAEDGSVF